MNITLIRQLLEQMLDPGQYEMYVSKLRDWFSNGVSKEQLESELAPILQGEVLQLHNQLLYEILVQSGGILPTDTAIRNSSTENPYLGTDEDEMSGHPLDGGETAEGATSKFSVQSCNGDELDQVVESLDTSNRFPTCFMKDFYGESDENEEPHVLLNVTHGLSCVAENISRDESLRKFFPSRNGIVLTSEANLYARFLMEAWKRKLESVEAEALNFAVKAALMHMKKVIIETLKQARSFRVRNDGYVHSIGAPYPNPYLRQGHHLYEDSYCSDTAQLADVMQIPPYLPTQDERERLAALQVAAAVPTKFPHLRTTICLADLLDAIENNRGLIPNYNRRLKICELILQKSRGYGDAYNLYKEGKDLVAKTVYPIVFY